MSELMIPISVAASDIQNEESGIKCWVLVLDFLACDLEVWSELLVGSKSSTN